MSDHDIHFKRTERRMQLIGKAVQKRLPKDWGFCVICFPFDPAFSGTLYVSNAQRDDMVEALRETVERFESEEVNPPGADPEQYSAGAPSAGGNRMDYEPASLDEAINRLGEMGALDLEEWLATPEDEALATAHHSIGRWIRNNWGLWKQKGGLYDELHAQGLRHADDMSGVVLLSFHRSWNGRFIRLDDQVRKVRQYWRSQGIDPDTLEADAS